MDGGEHGRIGYSAASRYARPPPPAPVHAPDTRARPLTTPANSTAITLDQIRTGPRPQNEYVDNPTASQVPAIPPRRATTQPPTVVNPRDILHTVVPRPERETLLQSERTTTLSPAPTIFRQPTASALKVPNTTDSHKDNVINKDLTLENEHGRHSTAESIICHRCGRCKCHQCTQHRELPSTWICNNKCRCSAIDMVEYCSCVCGVKAMFYHCTNDSDGDFGESDDPCGCYEQTHCCKRWTTMGLLSICFPCLCCYWPLRCAVAACTACYNRCRRRGCHCRKDKCQNMSRLLIDSESSSA